MNQKQVENRISCNKQLLGNECLDIRDMNGNTESIYEDKVINIEKMESLSSIQAEHGKKIVKLEGMLGEVKSSIFDMKSISSESDNRRGIGKDISKDVKNLSCIAISHQSDKNSFSSYLRNGCYENGSSMERMNEFNIKSSNEFILPNSNILHSLKDTIDGASFMRQLSKRISISNSCFEYIKPHFDENAAWFSNSQLESSTIDMQKYSIPIYDLEARSRVTQNMLDDSSFNIEEWFIDEIGIIFANLEERAFLSGSGNGMPSGLIKNKSITNTEIDIKDLSFDSFVSLFYSLNPLFIKNAKFMVSHNVAKYLSILRDNSGRYIMDTVLRDGVDKILGCDVIVSPLAEDVNGDDLIIFGNFGEGYLIIDRDEIKVMRNPFIDQRFVTYFVTRRVGGDVIRADAFKILRIKNAKKSIK